MQKIGITERGDAGIDMPWIDKIQNDDLAFSILITKNLNHNFCDKLMQMTDAGKKLILHATITGWGGTNIEPNVPNVYESLSALHSLLAKGFPENRLVLRIDPIIPSEEGILNALSVLNKASVYLHDYFSDIRIRCSVLDMYPHVRARYAACNIPCPMPAFSATDHQFYDIAMALEKWGNEHEKTFETCAEPKLSEYSQLFKNVGCISEKDFAAVGLQPENNVPSGMQRGNCLCLTGKTELLTQKHRCPHQCVYCYWKD